MTNDLIPLYRNGAVVVYPDYEGDGRSVLVETAGLLSIEPAAKWGWRIQAYSAEVAARRCFVHPERTAAMFGNLPCAPGGRLALCAECGNGSPESSRIVFSAYQRSHQKNIAAFKQENPGS